MIKDEYIYKFYKEINSVLEGEYKIILEPKRTIIEDWIEYDNVKWELEDNLQELVNELTQNTNLSFEEKLLNIYEYICLNYIYDDNVLYFFRKDDSDINNIKYIAVDWYGRIINNQWKENRKKHNRRVCYEFARFYAKAINDLLVDNNDLEAFMLGDKDNLHYVVGLSGNKYSALLDLDDFNSIKDLTRIKLGLTLKGIRILRDENSELKNAISNFNKDRLNELPIIDSFDNKDLINYFQNVINILKPYNIDSQGFMEYMRAVIENKEIEVEKIWQLIEGGPEKRYVRCLTFKLNSETYLLDSVKQSLTKTNIYKIDKNLFVFNPAENEYDYYGS